MNIKEKFTSIYDTNYWNSKESRSGSGSEIEATVEIRKWLSELIEKYSITSMVDTPCGDFNWMKLVQFPDKFSYIGVDIVDKLILSNIELYEDNSTSFYTKNLLEDQIPQADLIFCKDLLLHLSWEDCKKVIENFKKSGSKYLVISNGIHQTTKNEDIETGGGWRPVNLQIEPFNFPNYIELLDAGFTQMTMYQIDQL